MHLGGDEVPFDCWLVSCHPQALELAFGNKGNGLRPTVTWRSGHVTMSRDLLQTAFQGPQACLTFYNSVCHHNAFVQCTLEHLSQFVHQLLACSAGMLMGSCLSLRIANTCQ